MSSDKDEPRSHEILMFVTDKMTNDDETLQKLNCYTYSGRTMGAIKLPQCHSIDFLKTNKN